MCLATQLSMYLYATVISTTVTGTSSDAIHGKHRCMWLCMFVAGCDKMSNMTIIFCYGLRHLCSEEANVCMKGKLTAYLGCDKVLHYFFVNLACLHV